MKSIIIACFALFSIAAHANLTSYMEAGVFHINGSMGDSEINIRKYKEAGVCYTNGNVGDKKFSFVSYMEAGDKIMRGNLPEIVIELLKENGYNKPLGCSFFGLSG